MNMHKKIIALGVSAASVAALAVSTVAPASAAAPSALVSGICSNLTSTITSVETLVSGGDQAVADAAADLATKQTAVPAAVDGLASAIVGYVKAVDSGNGVNTAVAVLNAANAVFADKIVAENDAMTAWFEAQRSHYMNGLNAGYLADVKSGLCTV